MPRIPEMSRLNPLFIRSQFQMRVLEITRKERVNRLNPLFIRSQFQMVMDNLFSDSHPWQSGLNPLFIRSQFQISRTLLGSVRRRQRVSIPYSSGLSFRWIIFYTMAFSGAVSQSLIHQVSVSDGATGFNWWLMEHCLNPLFIRSQFQIIVKLSLLSWHRSLSQSLIHQVSVSDSSLFPANKYR